MKLNPANSVSDNLKKAESIFKKYNPSYPFEYYFLDEDYANKFANEKRTGKLAGLFAGLTIFISCLGLFGLASFTAENRIKGNWNPESIGCFRFQYHTIVFRGFSQTDFVSFLIASPFAWWVMNGLAAVISHTVFRQLVDFCRYFITVCFDRFTDDQFSIGESSDDESGEKFEIGMSQV